LFAASALVVLLAVFLLLVVMVKHEGRQALDRDALNARGYKDAVLDAYQFVRKAGPSRTIMDPELDPGYYAESMHAWMDAAHQEHSGRKAVHAVIGPARAGTANGVIQPSGPWLIERHVLVVPDGSRRFTMPGSLDTGSSAVRSGDLLGGGNGVHGSPSP
jgi:hypothetical protein